MTLPRYSSYKDSGVEWLGKVPSHWASPPLWTLFRRTKRVGYEGEQLLSVYRDYGVIPKSSREDNFNKPSDDLSTYQLVEHGDLVINKMKAWQGSVAISEHRGIVSPAYFVYQSTNTENGRFFHYLMRSPQYTAGYLSLSKGIRVNQWDLEPEYHSRMPVLIPPPDEQAAIADFLDRETGKIDALVAEQERLIALLAEKRQAVISHAVTKGLDPTAPMKPSGIDWLGDIPAHWEVRALKHIVSTPITDGPHETPDFSDEGIPFVSAEAVSSGKIDFGKIRGFISEADHKRYSEKYKPQRNDIYMIKSGATTGVTAIVDTDADFNIWSPLAAIRCGEGSIPRFALNFMRSKNFQEAVTLNWSFGTQQNIGMGVIENLSVTIPPINEQIKIAERLELMTAMFDKLISEANKAISLLQERRTALISAAVTGKIDVRGQARKEKAA